MLSFLSSNHELRWGWGCLMSACMLRQQKRGGLNNGSQRRSLTTWRGPQQKRLARPICNWILPCLTNVQLSHSSRTGLRVMFVPYPHVIMTGLIWHWQEWQIADGLSRLKHRHGGFLECLTMYSPHFQSGPTKIAGPVFTVKFAPKNDVVAPKVSGHYVCWVPSKILRKTCRRITDWPNPERCHPFHLSATSSYQLCLWRSHGPEST